MVTLALLSIFLENSAGGDLVNHAHARSSGSDEKLGPPNKQ